MNKFIAIIAATVVALSAGVAQAADPTAPITIGAAVSVTGTFAIDGKSTRRGYDMWADAVNARGGIDVAGTKRKVKIIYYDDESDPETSVKLVQRLISQDKVDFLFGPYSSGLTIATSAIAAKYKKLMFAGAAAATSVFNRKNLYVFGPLSLTTNYTTTGLDALKALGVETIGIMHTTDAPMLDIKDATIKHAESIGMKVVSVQAVPVGVMEITGAMRQIQAKNPNAFFMASASTVTGILATRTMRSIGWAPEYVSMVQAPTEVFFVKELGAKNTEGIMAPTQWMPNNTWKDKDFGTAQDYFDTFVKKYGEKPSYLPAGASAAGQSLAFAIEKAGSIDTEKVRQALLGLKVETIYGSISYSGPDDPSGLTGANLHRTMQTIQLDGEGNQIVVAPKAIAAAPIQKFKPWGAR
jgi:branched-chain amino acid transport system substrate-binding protein